MSIFNQAVPRDLGEAYGPEEAAPTVDPLVERIRQKMAQKRPDPLVEKIKQRQAARLAAAAQPEEPGVLDRATDTLGSFGIGLMAGIPGAVGQAGRLAQSAAAVVRNPGQAIGTAVAGGVRSLLDPGSMMGVPGAGPVEQMGQAASRAIDAGAMALPYTAPGPIETALGGAAGQVAEGGARIANVIRSAAPPKAQESFTPESVFLSAGESMPQMAASAAGGIVGGAVGGPPGAFAGMFAPALLAESAANVEQNYQSLKQANPGMADEEALTRSFIPAVAAAVPSSLLDVATGGEAAAVKGVARAQVEKTAKSLMRRVLEGGRTIGQALIEEGATEPIQGTFSDIASGVVSPQTTPLTPEHVTGFLSRRGMETLVGSAMGGGGGVVGAIGDVVGPAKPPKPTAQQRETAKAHPEAAGETIDPDNAPAPPAVNPMQNPAVQAAMSRLKPVQPTPVAAAPTPTAPAEAAPDPTARVLADLGIDPADFAAKVQAEADKDLIEQDPAKLTPEMRQRRNQAIVSELRRRAENFQQGEAFRAEEARKAEMLAAARQQEDDARRQKRVDRKQARRNLRNPDEDEGFGQPALPEVQPQTPSSGAGPIPSSSAGVTESGTSPSVPAPSGSTIQSPSSESRPGVPSPERTPESEGASTSPEPGSREEVTHRLEAKVAAGMDRSAAFNEVQQELTAEANARMDEDGAILVDIYGDEYQVSHERTEAGGPKNKRALTKLTEDGKRIEDPNARPWINPDDAILTARGLRPKSTPTIALSPPPTPRAQEAPAPGSAPTETKPFDPDRGLTLGEGDTPKTSSGRTTTPFPKLDFGSEARTRNTLRRTTQWLIDNAIAEARERGDEFNAPVFSRMTPKNASDADRASLNEYLFGEQPPVQKPITRPLVEKAEPAPEPTKTAAPHFRDKKGILTPAGAIGAGGLGKSRPPSAPWYYQGDPSNMKMAASVRMPGEDAAVREAAQERLAKAQAAQKSGWRLTNYRAGKLGTVWVFEKDGNFLTNAGFEAMTAEAGQRPETSPDSTEGTEVPFAPRMREYARAFVEWMKTLPSGLDSDAGTVSRALSANGQMSKWARISTSPVGQKYQIDFLNKDGKGDLRLFGDTVAELILNIKDKAGVLATPKVAPATPKVAEPPRVARSEGTPKAKAERLEGGVTRTDGLAAVFGGRINELRVQNKSSVKDGWYYSERDWGATLIHPNEDRVIRFEAMDASKYAQVLRARMEAHAYAQDNPVQATAQTAQPPGELVVKPIFEKPAETTLSPEKEARLAELKKRLAAKLNTELRSGFDPEMFAIGAEMTALYVEKGVKTFAAYARQMVADLGDAVKPYLKSFYNGARDMPGVDASGMDSADVVSKADVEAMLREEAQTPGDALAIEAGIDLAELNDVRAKAAAVVVEPNSPARVRKRKEIADKMYGTGASQKNRQAFLLLGPPASGKSTFAKRIVAQHGAIVVDPDDAKRALPEYERGLGGNALHKESVQIHDTVLSRVVQNGDNVVIPRVGADPSGIESTMRMMEEAGFSVHVILLEIPPTEAARRSWSRFRGGDQGFIDPSYIVRVGDTPQKTYAAIKGRVASYARADNDVPWGKPARVIESSGIAGSVLGTDRLPGQSDGRGPRGVSEPAHGRDAPQGDRGTPRQGDRPEDAAADQAVKAIDSESIDYDDGTSMVRHSLSDGSFVDVTPGLAEHWRPATAAGGRTVGRIALKSYGTLEEAIAGANTRTVTPPAAEIAPPEPAPLDDKVGKALGGSAAKPEVTKIGKYEVGKNASGWFMHWTDPSGAGQGRSGLKTRDEAVALANAANAKDEENLKYRRATYPMALSEWPAIRNKVVRAELSADEHKEMYRWLIRSEAAIKEELGKQTLKQLTGQSSVSGYNKGQIIEATFRRMVDRFVIGESVTYQPFGADGTRNTYESAVNAQVESITDEKIAAYREKINKAVEENKKALENPETLEEFRLFIAKKGESALSLDQRKRRDELIAAAEMKSNNRPDYISKVDTGSVVLTYKEGFHEKQQIPLHIVQMTGRVPDETYRALVAAAKKLGGWWSSFKKDSTGFQFKTKEAADEFIKINQQAITTEKTDAAREDNQAQQTADRLIAMADEKLNAADEALNRDRNTNTVRRARMAESAESSARKAKQMAETLANIAEAIKNGTAKVLKYVKNMKQLEEIERMLMLAQREYWYALPEESRRQIDPSGEWWNLPIDENVIAKVVMPKAEPGIAHLQAIAEAGLKTSGIKREAAKVDKLWRHAKRMKPDAYVVTIDNPYDFTAVKEVASRLKSAGSAKYAAEAVHESLMHHQRIADLGIRSSEAARVAVREYQQFRAGQQKPDAIREMERALIGTTVGVDFFPTPPSVANDLVQKADIEAGMKVLEPSAGNGRIADAIKAVGVDPDVVEMSSSLRAILTAKGHNVVAHDFTDYNPGPIYDRIVMNPPFSNRLDIEHVRHAYTLLKPGGRIVAIMSEGPFFGSDKKAAEFREWLDEVGVSEKLEEGTFLQDKSGLPTTGVNTRMVVIDKPQVGEATQPAPKAEEAETEAPAEVSSPEAPGTAAAAENKGDPVEGLPPEVRPGTPIVRTTPAPGTPERANLDSATDYFDKERERLTNEIVEAKKRAEKFRRGSKAKDRALDEVNQIANQRDTLWKSSEKATKDRFRAKLEDTTEHADPAVSAAARWALLDSVRGKRASEVMNQTIAWITDYLRPKVAAVKPTEFTDTLTPEQEADAVKKAAADIATDMLAYPLLYPEAERMQKSIEGRLWKFRKAAFDDWAVQESKDLDAAMRKHDEFYTDQMGVDLRGKIGKGYDYKSILDHLQQMRDKAEQTSKDARDDAKNGIKATAEMIRTMQPKQAERYMNSMPTPALARLVYRNTGNKTNIQSILNERHREYAASNPAGDGAQYANQQNRGGIYDLAIQGGGEHAATEAWISAQRREPFVIPAPPEKPPLRAPMLLTGEMLFQPFLDPKTLRMAASNKDDGGSIVPDGGDTPMKLLLEIADAEREAEGLGLKPKERKALPDYLFDRMRVENGQFVIRMKSAVYRLSIEAMGLDPDTFADGQEFVIDWPSIERTEARRKELGKLPEAELDAKMEAIEGAYGGTFAGKSKAASVRQIMLSETGQPLTAPERAKELGERLIESADAVIAKARERLAARAQARGFRLYSNPIPDPRDMRDIVLVATATAVKITGKALTSQTGRALTATVNKVIADLRPEFAAHAADIRRAVVKAIKAMNGDPERFDRVLSELGKPRATKAEARRQAKAGAAARKEAVAGLTTPPAEEPTITPAEALKGSLKAQETATTRLQRKAEAEIRKLENRVLEANREGQRQGWMQAANDVKTLEGQVRAAARRLRDIANLERQGGRNEQQAIQAVREGIRKNVLEYAKKLPPKVRGKLVGSILNAVTPAQYVAAMRRLEKESYRDLGRMAWSGIARQIKGDKLKTGKGMTDAVRGAIREQVRAAQVLRKTMLSPEANTTELQAAARGLVEVYQEIRTLITAAASQFEKIDLGRRITAWQAAQKLVKDIKATRKPADTTGEKKDPDVSKIVQVARKARDIRNAVITVEGLEGDRVLHTLMYDNAVKAERDYLSTLRDKHEDLEKAVMAAGFDSVADAIEGMSGRAGRGVTSYITATLGGEQVKITLGDALSLVAHSTDPQTAALIATGEQAFNTERGTGVSALTVSPEEVAAVKAQLDPKYVEMIGKIKGIFEGMREAAFKARYMLTGVEPEAVAGRWPRRRNMQQSPAAAKLPDSVAEWINAFIENDGMFESRVANSTIPIVLENPLSVALDQIEKSAKMAHLGIPTRDAANVLLNPEVRTAIVERFGLSYFNDLKSQLMAFSRAEVALRTGGARAAQAINQIASTTSIATNLKTWAKNAISVVRLLPWMRADDIIAGMKDVIAGKAPMTDLVRLSGYFWDRYTQHAAARFSSSMLTGEQDRLKTSGFAREFQAFYRNVAAGDIGGAGKALRRASARTLMMVNFFDGLVARTAYAAAKRAARRAHPDWTEGRVERAAAKRAEVVIRETQNPSSPLDAAMGPTQYRESAMSALTLFSSDSFKARNRIARAFRESNARGSTVLAAEVASILMGAYAARVIGGAVAAAFAAAFGWDDEDEERIVSEYLAPPQPMLDAARDLAGMFVPIVGSSVFEIARSAASGRPIRRDVVAAPGLEILNEAAVQPFVAANAIARAIDGSDENAEAKAAIAIGRMVNEVLGASGINPFAPYIRQGLREAAEAVR